MVTGGGVVQGKSKVGLFIIGGLSKHGKEESSNLVHTVDVGKILSITKSSRKV